MDANQSFNMWPNKDVLLVCEDSNYFSIIREILRPLKWTVQLPTTNAQTTREKILSNTFGAIVIVDSGKLPATEILRMIFQSDRGRLCPILVLTQFTESSDRQLFQKIFNVTISTKPIIPIKFMAAFKEMLLHWEQPAMHALRQLATIPPGHNTDTLKVSILEKLATDGNAAPVAIQAMMVIMTNQHLYREAEKKLLEYFRTWPGNVAVLAECAWFYLDSRAPHYALKFLNKLKQIAPSSCILNLDLACAHIACGHLDQAIEALQEWNLRFPGNTAVESNIARLAIAEGKNSAELFGVPHPIIKRANEAWESFDTKLRATKNQALNRIKAS
jgi:DNA-binding response OmpR family regulator